MATTVLESGLTIDRGAIDLACRRFGVRRLDLFGSAVTERFDPGRSDVDLIVTFEFEGWQGRAARYFGLVEELETLFGRPVDLLTDQAVRNPYLKAEIERTRQPLYPWP